MPRYCALLRAINVGGHTVKMAELCALLAPLKLANLTSVIASGNLLFESSSTDAAKLEQRIEKCLLDSLGYEVTTFVRTPAEMQSIVDHVPFPEPGVFREGDKMQVVFLKGPVPRPVAERIVALRTEIDELRVHGREIYWRYRGGISDSLVKPVAFARACQGEGTARNITTVRKLAEKLAK